VPSATEQTPDTKRLILLGTGLRRELSDRNMAEGFEHVTSERLGGIVDRCGDMDLAISAVTMRPRPVWVAEEIGL
jgi:hypothetical protein